jgi:hypothetical protein
MEPAWQRSVAADRFKIQGISALGADLAGQAGEFVAAVGTDDPEIRQGAATIAFPQPAPQAEFAPLGPQPVPPFAAGLPVAAEQGVKRPPR